MFSLFAAHHGLSPGWFVGMAVVYFGMEFNGSASRYNSVWEFVAGFWHLVWDGIILGALVAIFIFAILILEEHSQRKKEKFRQEKEEEQRRAAAEWRRQEARPYKSGKTFARNRAR